jgi:hypothetical protein
VVAIVETGDLRAPWLAALRVRALTTQRQALAEASRATLELRLAAGDRAVAIVALRRALAALEASDG